MEPGGRGELDELENYVIASKARQSPAVHYRYA